MPLTIHFLNVGHGDCTFIELPSERLMLVDINNSTTLPVEDEIALAENRGISLEMFKAATSTRQSWEEYYASLLVDPAEYYANHFAGRPIFRYVQTHPDADHMSGLHRLFWVDEVPLLNFWDVRNSKPRDEGNIDWTVYFLLQRGSGPGDREHRVLRLTPGDSGQYWTDDEITVLSPSTEITDYCDEIKQWNNASYVLRLEYGGRAVILAGDAEKPAWDHIESHVDHDLLKADLLKAAHHGRESGYSESAVELIDPEIVVCSVGKKPDTDASDEYAAQGGQVLSTRYHGSITATIWFDGEVWLTDHRGKRIAELPPIQ